MIELVELIVDVIALSVAIFVGSALFDWWRHRGM